MAFVAVPVQRVEFAGLLALAVDLPRGGRRDGGLLQVPGPVLLQRERLRVRQRVRQGGRIVQARAAD